MLIEILDFVDVQGQHLCVKMAYRVVMGVGSCIIDLGEDCVFSVPVESRISCNGEIWTGTGDVEVLINSSSISSMCSRQTLKNT